MIIKIISVILILSVVVGSLYLLDLKKDDPDKYFEDEKQFSDDFIDTKQKELIDKFSPELPLRRFNEAYD